MPEDSAGILAAGCGATGADFFRGRVHHLRGGGSRLSPRGAEPGEEAAQRVRLLLAQFAQKAQE